MKQLTSVLLALCVCLSFGIPVLADVIWEPPETVQPIPIPVSGGGTGGGNGLLLSVVVSVICIALGVLIALIVQRRNGKK